MPRDLKIFRRNWSVVVISLCNSSGVKSRFLLQFWLKPKPKQYLDKVGCFCWFLCLMVEFYLSGLELEQDLFRELCEARASFLLCLRSAGH